ncbi:hypothetical protein B484DRAFT_458180 [Ochromonadaceae sp. CCMP2298]|nr:hypothetical protein B484DRAFT_458180 [Ochromonadaceae sp. CCMP2298]
MGLGSHLHLLHLHLCRVLYVTAVGAVGAVEAVGTVGVCAVEGGGAGRAPRQCVRLQQMRGSVPLRAERGRREGAGWRTGREDAHCYKAQQPVEGLAPQTLTRPSMGTVGAVVVVAVAVVVARGVVGAGAVVVGRESV